jgi:hypothetical protein
MLLSAVLADVRSDLAAMRAELAEIRRARQEAWADGQRAAEIRALVADALADSGARTAWSGAGSGSLVTGYDEARGFFLGLDDGAWSIRAFGFGQVRFVWNDGFDAQARTPASDDVWGMEIAGRWDDPCDLQVVREDPAVLDAQPPQISYLTVTKQLGDGWFLQAGSIFTPFTYESHLFSTAQTQMGECSMLEWLFTASFTTGASVGNNGDHVRWQAVIGDQVGGSPGTWDDDANQSVAVAGRVNWRLCGTWEQYALETSFPGQPFGAFVGVGGRLQNGRAQNPASADGLNPRAVTADLALMFGGANLILQGVCADQWISGGGTSWGALAQGGVFVAPAVGAFASVGAADVGGTQSRVNVGANWYLSRQALKLTAMAIVPLSPIPSNFATAVLPPQGLAGGAAPNNNVSLLVQLQAEF